jgi:hypothetical protein
MSFDVQCTSENPFLGLAWIPGSRLRRAPE